MPNATTAAHWLAALIISVPHGGCVAMNIPSQRLHDLGDGGGMLGSWNGVSTGNSIEHHEQPCEDGFCLGGGPLGGGFDDGFDQEFDADDFAKEPPKADPVPWPRYHPIPTRPAFSPPTTSDFGPY